MHTRRRHALITGSPVALNLTLGACGGSDGGGEPKDDSPKTSAAAPAGDAFCDQLKANGATGASFGPVPLFYPKDELIPQVESDLEAMGDATPPDELAQHLDRAQGPPDADQG